MSEEHPEMLAWYVAGSLAGEPAQEVEAHLERCRRCRREAQDLSTLRDVLRAARSDHIPAETLVDYESGVDLPPAERDPIAWHLERCADCREDLASLSGENETPAVVAGPLPTFAVPARRRALLAVAAVLAALLLGVPAMLWFFQPSPEGALAHARRVVLLPGTRGGERTEIAAGTRPWSMEVGLPWGAPDGPYDVRIETARGLRLPGTETRAVADENATLILILRSPPGPGRYVLRAEPSGGGGSTGPYTYPFGVTPPTGSAGTGEPEGRGSP